MVQDSATLKKFNVNSVGEGSPTLVLAHGFGTDQTAWRYQVAAFAKRHRIILFDYLGCGKSDIAAYNPLHYKSLENYAEDLLTIYQTLGLSDTIFVGHSASAMVGLLATRRAPNLFRKLIFLSASPRYLDAPGYVGGFTQSDLEAIYAGMASNYLGWANGFCSVMMSNSDKPGLQRDFNESLARMRPDIAQTTARMIFESDFRPYLKEVQQPVLVLQPKTDPAVPLQVGEYLAAQLPHSEFQLLDVDGHLAHLTAPQEVAKAIANYLYAN